MGREKGGRGGKKGRKGTGRDEPWLARGVPELRAWS